MDSRASYEFKTPTKNHSPQDTTILDEENPKYVNLYNSDDSDVEPDQINFNQAKPVSNESYGKQEDDSNERDSTHEPTMNDINDTSENNIHEIQKDNGSEIQKDNGSKIQKDNGGQKDDEGQKSEYNIGERSEYNGGERSDGQSFPEITYGDALRESVYRYYSIRNKQQLMIFKDTIFPYLLYHASHGKFHLELTSWSKAIGKEIFDEILKNVDVYKIIMHHEGLKLEIISKSVSMTRTIVKISWFNLD